MADLHSAAGNEGPRCNCFGWSGTNPGCPVHGNHATPPAESAVDGPTGPGAGETTTGPGWDRRTIQALIDDQYSYDRCHTPEECYNCRAQEKSAEQRVGQLRALLAERDRLAVERSAVTVAAAADALREASTCTNCLDDSQLLIDMANEVAARRRTIPPTDRSSDA